MIFPRGKIELGPGGPAPLAQGRTPHAKQSPGLFRGCVSPGKDG